MLLNPRFQRNVAFVLVFACFAFVFGEYTVLASGSSETESQLEISDEMLIVTIQQFMTEEEIQAIESEFKESLGDPQVQGVLGGTLKVLRYVGWAFRTGGKALSKILGYFSKKNAKLLRVYSGKIGKALEWPSKVTKKAIVAALTKAGIPKGDANRIAELLLWLI